MARTAIYKRLSWVAAFLYRHGWGFGRQNLSRWEVLAASASAIVQAAGRWGEGCFFAPLLTTIADKLCVRHEFSIHQGQEEEVSMMCATWPGTYVDLSLRLLHVYKATHKALYRAQSSYIWSCLLLHSASQKRIYSLATLAECLCYILTQRVLIQHLWWSHKAVGRSCHVAMLDSWWGSGHSWRQQRTEGWAGRGAGKRRGSHGKETTRGRAGWRRTIRPPGCTQLVCINTGREEASGEAMGWQGWCMRSCTLAVFTTSFWSILLNITKSLRDYCLLHHLYSYTMAGDCDNRVRKHDAGICCTSQINASCYETYLVTDVQWNHSSICAHFTTALRCA